MESDEKEVNIQLEKLKAKSIQITVEMVKTRLSEFLVDEIVEVDQRFNNAKVLFRDIESKEDLSALKAFFESNKSKLPAGLLSYCQEELREMTSDLKWSRSKQGKAVMQLEKWVVDTRAHLASLDQFQSIFVGRDWNDPTVLVVSGIVENDHQRKELEAVIQRLNPPVEPKYELEKKGD